jgi:hypothetical protein
LSSLWQNPSIAITVSSAIFAISYSFVHVLWVSGIILLFGGVFNLTIAVTLTKHRVTIETKTVFLRKFAEKYGLEYLPFKTEKMLEYLNADYGGVESEHQTNSWFRKRNAFRWTFGSILLLSGVLFSLGFYNLLLGIFNFL